MYLLLTGSQFSDFLSHFFTFVSVFPGAGWLQRSSSNAGFIQTKILLQISLTRDGLYWREEPVDQSSDFSSSTVSPGHATWLT